MRHIQTLAQIKAERARTEERLYRMAFALIEMKARKLLQAHNLNEFVMAMGGWLFTRKDSLDDISSDCLPAYARPFARMMDEFDHMEMKVTGEPMRFTANGPVIRNW